MAASGASAAVAPVAAFDRVRELLTRLVARFGLAPQQAAILACYDAVCSRSLAFPLGARLPLYSRLNEDGTPIQLATVAGAGERPLGFVGEAGWPGAPGSERLRAARECLVQVAGILSAGAGCAPGIRLQEHAELLAALAPPDDPELANDPAGALWIGATFARSRPPQLRVYANGSWGRPEARWTRLRRVAEEFGARDAWREAEELLASTMKPLGSALTFAADGSTRARIYLSAYGERMGFYAGVARAVGGSRFADVVATFADQLLGDDRAYPTATVVCSFGLAAGRPLDLKIELCLHCLFASDVAARDRLRRSLAAVGASPRAYERLLEVVSDGELSGGALAVHSYAGVGWRRDGVYCPVYLKPPLTG